MLTQSDGVYTSVRFAFFGVDPGYLFTEEAVPDDTRICNVRLG